MKEKWINKGYFVAVLHNYSFVFDKQKIRLKFYRRKSVESCNTRLTEGL
jgi:hypothetical protein